MKTVRVFVSSTFRDMHAERDCLVTVVFPELRERCERLGLEFFDVDLRWGVPEKGVDGETANSWEYCRLWIDRVQPFFVCLLGQRYGWEPEPRELKDEAGRLRQQEEKRSITDMEIHYAVLNEPEQKRLSYFYLRRTEAPASAAEYVDPEPAAAKLRKLKEAVEQSGRPVRRYDCVWTGDRFTRMDAFGKAMLEDLWSGILRDPRYVGKDIWRLALDGADPDADPCYTDETLPVPENLAEKLVSLAKPPPKDPLDAERKEMHRFAEGRLRWFQGREDELRRLHDFIHGPAADQPRLAVLAARPGQGKSALIAKLLSQLSPPDSQLLLIPHFVGATEQSSSSYRLVLRLLDELDASGIAFPEPPAPGGEEQPKEELKLDFQSLCQRLSERLGDYDGETRIVLLLDALNQLDDGHNLAWLPQRLGPGVRVVASCIEEEEGGNIPEKEKVPPPHFPTQTPSQQVLAALDSRYPKPARIPLGGLDAEDVRAIINGYLVEYCKELDTGHIATLCALPQARTPLYLLVLLAELRTLGGNDMNQHVPALIADLGTKHPDTLSLFHWVLERMEQAEGFGCEPVRWWNLYLALGRAGMSSAELAALLDRKFPGQSAALVAQRIERGLRRYLQRRGGQWDFFHGQLRQAVMERCCGEETIRQAHRGIAAYFRALTDPAEDGSWAGESPRPFQETAYHLIGGEQWEEVCVWLTDLPCLETRFRDGQVFAVVADQAAALAALPEFREETERNQRRDAAMIAYNRQLQGYAKQRLDWWLAKERGETLPEPPYPPLPEALRNEAKGPMPEESSERAARLRHFASFVSEHPTLLSEHPGEILPLAWNWAESGPVPEAAEQHIEARKLPWLRCVPRPPARPLRPQCLRVLEGHTSFVNSVSISPDGRRALSGSSDDTLRLWDLETGKCLRVLQKNNWSINTFNSVSINPDGRRALSGGTDKTIRLWDLETSQCLRVLEGHIDEVTSVSISPDGRHAVSGGGSWFSDNKDCTLRFWDLESGQCLRVLEGHSKAVNSVSISPDGRRALSGSSDDTLRLWDLETGQCLRILEGHNDKVYSVSISPDGRHALSGGLGAALRLWDLETGQCLRVLKEQIWCVESVSISPDGRRALSGGNGRLRLWDLETGQCLRALAGDGSVGFSPGGSVGFSPDGRHALSSSEDKNLRLWNLKTGQSHRALDRHIGWRKSVSISPDGRHALTRSEDKTLRLWDLKTGEYLLVPEGRTEGVTSVSVSPDGRLVLSGSWGAIINLRLWDLESGQCLHFRKGGHDKDVISVSISLDGRHALSGSEDKTIRLWDLKTGECLRVLHLQGHTDYVRSVIFSPNGRHALSGSDDETLRLWDLETGQCLRVLEGHKGRVLSVSLSPDGRRALSGSSDDTLRLWDLESGECLRVFEGHNDKVNSVSISPDGRHAISGSEDKTLRLWDLETGQCLVVHRYSSPVEIVAFSHDGRRICAISDRQMYFLSLVNGPPSGPLIVTPARLWSVSEIEKTDLPRLKRLLYFLLGRQHPPGHWDDTPTARCPHCATTFAPSSPVLTALADPPPSYNDPRLLAPCPQCGEDLRFNPFVVGGS